MKYRAKPIIIEALEWDGTQACYERIRNFSDGRIQWGALVLHKGHELLAATAKGVMRASVGDFIIKGLRGEFSSCKPDVFHATYEVIE